MLIYTTLIFETDTSIQQDTHVGVTYSKNWHI